MESKNITDTYIYHRLGRRRAVPIVAQMPYRDSAEAGETGTDEERGEAESKRESKAVISSLNSMELSKTVSADGKRYLSRHTVCPKCRSVTEDAIFYLYDSTGKNGKIFFGQPIYGTRAKVKCHLQQQAKYRT